MQENFPFKILLQIEIQKFKHLLHIKVKLNFVIKNGFHVALHIIYARLQISHPSA